MKLYDRPRAHMFADPDPDSPTWDDRKPWQYLPHAARDFIKLLEDNKVKLKVDKVYPERSHYSWSAISIDASIGDNFLRISPSFWFDYRDVKWTLTVRAKASETEAVIRTPFCQGLVEPMMTDGMLADLRAGLMRWSRDPVDCAPRPLP